jgi:hypothetical protein
MKYKDVNKTWTVYELQDQIDSISKMLNEHISFISKKDAEKYVIDKINNNPYYSEDSFVILQTYKKVRQ